MSAISYFNWFSTVVTFHTYILNIDLQSNWFAIIKSLSKRYRSDIQTVHLVSGSYDIAAQVASSEEVTSEWKDARVISMLASM